MALGTFRDVSGLTDAQVATLAASPIDIARPARAAAAGLSGGHLHFYRADASSPVPGQLRCSVSTLVAGQLESSDVAVNSVLSAPQMAALKPLLERLFVAVVGT